MSKQKRHAVRLKGKWASPYREGQVFEVEQKAAVIMVLERKWAAKIDAPPPSLMDAGIRCRCSDRPKLKE